MLKKFLAALSFAAAAAFLPHGAHLLVRGTAK
jgi:hypothetical protein